MRSLVAALVLGAAALAAYLATATRITPDLRLHAGAVVDLSVAKPPPPPPPPPTRYHDPRGTSVPVPRVPELELPAWFGDPDAPPAPIAGYVVGAATGLTVRLAVDVPDPGIWRGREVAVRDGRFDFGPMRRGAYLLVAWGPGVASRVLRLDTTRDPGDDTELLIAPCELIRGRVTGFAGAEVAGAAIERAGRTIGATDAHGGYTVCARDVDELELRLAGHVRAPVDSRRRSHELVPATTVVGTVLAANGTPAARVGVQPLWMVPGFHAPDYEASDQIVTTDAEGRFTYAGLPIFGFRVVRGLETQDVFPPDPLIDVDAAPRRVSPIRVVASGAIDHVLVQLARPSPPPAVRTLHGRVTYRGAPVGDALIRPVVDRGGLGYARTHGDGRFAARAPRPTGYLSETCPRREVVEAVDERRQLRGRAAIAWDAPEETTIELGPGLVVRGTVVDGAGRPVEGVRVIADGDWSGATPTASDGAFTLVLRTPGRHRPKVYDAATDLLAPAPGTLLPAIDVTVPDGERAGVRLVIQRVRLGRDDDPAGCCDVDLGVRLDDDRRVVRVADEAAAAGLRVGDVVLSVDGVAFAVEPGGSVAWRARRGARILSFRARAPSFGLEE